MLDDDGAGYFRVTSVHSGKVLDVPSASAADGAALVQFTSNGGDHQKWRLVDLGGGAVHLLDRNSGEVAEVFRPRRPAPPRSTREPSTAAPSTSRQVPFLNQYAAIDPWTVNGGAHQIWQLTTP